MHVVVGAALKRADTIDGVRPLGPEHDHRHLPVPRPPRLAGTKASAEVELGNEDEIRKPPLGEVERLAAEARVQDLEAVRDELPLEVVARLGLGVGEEHGAQRS